jgi:hypothetical protein
MPIYNVPSAYYLFFKFLLYLIRLIFKFCVRATEYCNEKIAYWFKDKTPPLP